MKINGKTSNLAAGNVNVEKAKAKVSVSSETPLSKRFVRSFFRHIFHSILVRPLSVT